MYQILALGDDDDWTEDLRTGLTAVLDELSAGAIEVTWLAPADLPSVATTDAVVVVLLASEALRVDPQTVAVLDSALSSAFAVVPLIREGDSAEAVLPDNVKRLNAAQWQGDHSVACNAVLRALGIAERNRRVFISYRRTDTFAMAEQLHTAFSERGFEVFLDRFGVQIGEDFQKRVDIELANKSFVLVLESPGINESPWVRHEVNYAMAHGLPYLAITIPHTPAKKRVLAIDRGFRYELREDDLVWPSTLSARTILTARRIYRGVVRMLRLPSDAPTTGSADSLSRATLTAVSLQRILALVELEHSRLLRRRRNQLLGGLQDYLFMHDCETDLVDEWSILATKANKVPEVFTITPTNPDVLDLYNADRLRRQVEASLGIRPRATVVHDSEDLDPDLTVVHDWVSSAADLTAVLLRSGPGILQDVNP